MKAIVSVFALTLVGAFAGAAEYSFKMPVASSVEILEDAEAYEVSIALAKTKSFTPARNLQADYSHSEIILNKALSRHLKVGENRALSYSGRVFLGSTDMGGERSLYRYRVMKDAVSISEITPGEFDGSEPRKDGRPASAKTRLELLKSMPLSGYSARCKAALAASANSYLTSLSELADNLDGDNLSAAGSDFSRIYGEALADFDAASLGKKYESDAKLFRSDVSELLKLAEDARKNFEILREIFDRQLAVAELPISEENTKTALKLSREIEALKKTLREIKQ